MSVRAGERTQGNLTVTVKAKEMDCYFHGLFIYCLSEAEKARYEKLKRYNEQRQRAKKRKQEVKNNGKVIK